MLWNKKEKIIEASIEKILDTNYQFGQDLNDDIFEDFSIKSVLIILELYIYLYSLTDYFLNKNKVDQNIRERMINSLYKELTNPKNLSDLRFSQEEMKNFINSRIINYSKIINEYHGITVDYFEKVIEYQLQLFMEIIEKNKLSSFNPFPKGPWDYSPIHMDIFKISKLKSLLHDFFIGAIMPLAKVMDNNLINDYFTTLNWKIRE